MSETELFPELADCGAEIREDRPDLHGFYPSRRESLKLWPARELIDARGREILKRADGMSDIGALMPVAAHKLPSLYMHGHPYVASLAIVRGRDGWCEDPDPLFEVWVQWDRKRSSKSVYRADSLWDAIYKLNYSLHRKQNKSFRPPAGCPLRHVYQLHPLAVVQALEASLEDAGR